MDAVEQRLAGLRHQDDAIVGDGPDWATLEAAVLLGLDRRQRQAQMRRQLGWTGALALVTGLAGGMAQQPWPAAMGVDASAGPLALPAQAPSVVLMGAG